MPLDDARSPPVRPMADFAGALKLALAQLNRPMARRQRAAALARAHGEILAAADGVAKNIIRSAWPSLRAQVLGLAESHEQLLNLIEDLERQPAIAGELRRLRCSGEIRWEL